MQKRMSLIINMVLVIVMAGTFLSSCSSSSSAKSNTSSSTSASSASAGQALMQERCSLCHSLSRVTSAHKTADEWKATVDRMILRGAPLSAQEEQTLVEYL